MQIDNTIRPGALAIRNGVLAIGGYGVKIAVERRHLAVEDGVGRNRREGRFAKATCRLKRVLVVAQSGIVTLEALRWLSDLGAAFVQLDFDASILTASIGGLDDARLRRAQALIPSTSHLVPLSKELLVAKIRGQMAVLDSFGLAFHDDLENAIDAAESALDLTTMLKAEAKGAEAYWQAMEQIPMTFAQRDHVPDHWRSFLTRRSPLSLGPRNAANPVNALLNYLYALLETETRLALIGRGLDPGLGLFHADTANRPSLAADVMEPVRPHVDAYILNLLRTRTFSSKDFVETREGGCRLGSTMTQQLAATMPTWAQLVGPYAESLARNITLLARSGVGIVHPNTGLQRARVKVRIRPITTVAQPAVAATVPMSALHNACKWCGAVLTARKRVYCDDCLPKFRAEQQRSVFATFQTSGRAKLAAMRAAGHDPSNTGEARVRKLRNSRLQARARVAWRDDGSLDSVDFKRDIMPGLQLISTRVISEATGLTISHCSKIRTGRLVPHKRHWKTLARLK